MKAIDDFCDRLPVGIKVIVKALIYSITLPLAFLFGIYIRYLLGG